MYRFISIYYVDAGISTSMFIFGGLGPNILLRKMERTQPMRKEMDENVFFSRRSHRFSFVNNIFEVLFPTSYHDLACKQLCLPPGKRYK